MHEAMKPAAAPLATRRCIIPQTWLFLAVGHMFHTVPAQQRHARSLLCSSRHASQPPLDVEFSELQTQTLKFQTAKPRVQTDVLPPRRYCI